MAYWVVFCIINQEEGVKITANSLHPGAIATNLLRHHGFLDGKPPSLEIHIAMFLKYICGYSNLLDW